MRVILSPAEQSGSGNLKITKGQRIDWTGGRGSWARFDVQQADQAGTVYLRSVGHFEQGRSIFLGWDGNGSFTSQAEPVPFTVTPASEGIIEAPPVLELTGPMKASFVRDGYLHLAGAVSEDLVAGALRQINAHLGTGPDAFERSEDGVKLGGGVGSSAAILNLLYHSAAFGVAEQLLGGSKRPKAGQVALRFPSPPGDNATRSKGEEQWHIDGMHKTWHMHPFDLLVGVALSSQPEDDCGNLAVWPASHSVLHDAVGKMRQRHSDCAAADAASLAEDSADGAAGGSDAAADPWLGQKPSLAGRSVMQVHMAPGDLVVAHQKLAHRISFNRSPHIRYQVYFRLGAEGRDPEASLGGLWDNFRGIELSHNLAEAASRHAAGLNN